MPLTQARFEKLLEGTFAGDLKSSERLYDCIFSDLASVEKYGAALEERARVEIEKGNVRAMTLLGALHAARYRTSNLLAVRLYHPGLYDGPREREKAIVLFDQAIAAENDALAWLLKQDMVLGYHLYNGPDLKPALWLAKYNSWFARTDAYRKYSSYQEETISFLVQTVESGSLLARFYLANQYQSDGQYHKAIDQYNAIAASNHACVYHAIKSRLFYANHAPSPDETTEIEALLLLMYNALVRYSSDDVGVNKMKAYLVSGIVCSDLEKIIALRDIAKEHLSSTTTHQDNTFYSAILGLDDQRLEYYAEIEEVLYGNVKNALALISQIISNATSYHDENHWKHWQRYQTHLAFLDRMQACLEKKSVPPLEKLETLQKEAKAYLNNLPYKEDELAPKGKDYLSSEDWFIADFCEAVLADNEIRLQRFLEGMPVSKVVTEPCRRKAQYVFPDYASSPYRFRVRLAKCPEKSPEISEAQYPCEPELAKFDLNRPVKKVSVKKNAPSTAVATPVAANQKPLPQFFKPEFKHTIAKLPDEYVALVL